MSSDTEQRVFSIVAELKKIGPESLTLQSSLESLGFDSLDRVNLLFELESAFDLDIPDAVAKSIVTVGDIVSRLDEAIGGPQPQASGA